MIKTVVKDKNAAVVDYGKVGSGVARATRKQIQAALAVVGRRLQRAALASGFGSSRLYLLRDFVDIRVPEPLMALLGVIAPTQLCLLEEADHADDPELLAQYFHTLFTNLRQCHGLVFHC